MPLKYKVNRKSLEFEEFGIIEHAELLELCTTIVRRGWAAAPGFHAALFAWKEASAERLDFETNFLPKALLSLAIQGNGGREVVLFRCTVESPLTLHQEYWCWVLKSEYHKESYNVYSRQGDFRGRYPAHYFTQA